jgi:peptidase E
VRILAASSGFRPGRRTELEPGPLIDFAVELAGSPARLRFCHVGTASGDNPVYAANVAAAFVGRDVVVSALAAFPMPNVADVRAHLLAQDVVWVGGGSVAGLLAIWRLHGWDEIFREVWEAGVVLGGVSAGSLCWHVGGTTDSFGPDLRAVTDGLGLLPCSNGVHYDSDDQRRPLYRRLVADGSLPAGYATDDGVGLLYEGTELIGAVADRPGAAAWRVERGADGSAVETRIEPRLLAGADRPP